MDLMHRPVTELADRVRRRELSARELVEHSLERIDRLDGELGGFVALDPDGARAQAARLDERIVAGEEVGPLAGIPIAVKDLEDAAGFVTSYGSLLHVDDAPAAEDSALVARLRGAGCVVVGKTNTPEHGWQGDTVSPPFGATRNPWDLSRSPGGSSGGSGAAIAAGLVPLATGSDGGGSIRIPSSLCGLSGLKTSPGRIPIEAATRAPGAGLLSVKGPMARRIRDVAAALDVVVGPHPLDMYSFDAPPSGFAAAIAGEVAVPERVVWSPTMGFPVDAEVQRVTAAAVAALAEQGTEVIELDTVFTDDPVFPWFTMWCIYSHRTLAQHRGTPAWELIDPGLRAQVEIAAANFGVDDFAKALDAAVRAHADVEAVLERAPLLLTPTVAGQTGLSGAQGTIDGLEDIGWVRFTYPFNLTRHPAATVCAGFTEAGMPVGLQVVGSHLDDLGVVRATAALEDLLGNAERLPPLG